MATNFYDRVRIGARSLRWITYLALATVVAAALFKALSAQEQFWAANVNLQLEQPPGPRVWVATAQLAASGLFAWSLWQLARMLRHAEQGDLFGPRAVRHFRSFALFLFLSTVASALLPFLAQMLGGHGSTAKLVLRSSDAWAIFVSGLLFFIARLFEEAHRLAEDSRSIV